MPVQSCSIDNKSGYKWGDAGKCYHYNPDSTASKNVAYKKAIAQGVAINEFSGSKVSFDYDGTLSTPNGKELFKERKNQGDEVYIITARQEDGNNTSLFNVAKILGIRKDHIYFTNGKDKWEEIKRLGINVHYDNNQEQLDKIKENTIAIGILI